MIRSCGELKWSTRTSLAYHHLLHRGPGIRVQILKLGVHGDNLFGVNAGVALDDVAPPLHLVDFGQEDLQDALAGLRVQGPGALFGFDRLEQLALHIGKTRPNQTIADADAVSTTGNQFLGCPQNINSRR